MTVDRNDPLGCDLSCLTDIEPNGREVSGPDLVAQAILHRLTTDTLPLIDAPDGVVEYGVDVRRWVGESIGREELAARAATLGPIIERDERVVSTEVTATLDASNAAGLWSFALDITATLRTGQTISRVLRVEGLTIELLSQG